MIARDASAGEKELVAYIVPAAESEPDILSVPNGEDLRSFLLRHLPEYMVRGIFVSLHALPLNSSGKVDRRALPARNESNIVRSGLNVAPQTALQKDVMAMVEDLLGSREVGVNDNFFLQGGNSLLGVQLIARLRKAFGVDVPLAALFEGPTVAQLSAEIERLRSGESAEAQAEVDGLASSNEGEPHVRPCRVPA